LVNDELSRRQNALRFASPMPTDARADAAPDEIARAETRAMVHALIDQLPPDPREVIMLRFADDLSVADVAARLGRSPDAVKQLQRRALAGLRALATRGETDA
jgi:RNA polymerase sigma-70 factor (ECF subfamily)